jgi:3-hydroxybutyryl-CoA dehydrogenase
VLSLHSLSESFGKEVVNASDVPGFITNRVLMPWINEAIFCLNESIATPEDIDQAMKLGCNGMISIT